MFDFSQLTRRQRIILRNRTERLSELLDWNTLGIVSRKRDFMRIILIVSMFSITIVLDKWLYNVLILNLKKNSVKLYVVSFK
jgi:hypothetical protein